MLVLVAGTCLVVGQASATVSTLTFAGVANGLDEKSVFGGGNLTDAAFTAVFTTDDTAASAVTVQDGVTTVQGATTAAFTLNGVTIQLNYAPWGVIIKSGPPYIASGVDGNAYTRAACGCYVSDTLIINTHSLTDLFTGPDFNVGFGPHSIGAADSYYGQFVDQDFTKSTILDLHPRTVTYTVEGAAADGVPEPDVWALMIGGFSLAGAALRRRRTAVAAY